MIVEGHPLVLHGSETRIRNWLQLYEYAEPGGSTVDAGLGLIGLLDCLAMNSAVVVSVTGVNFAAFLDTARSPDGIALSASFTMWCFSSFSPPNLVYSLTQSWVTVMRRSNRFYLPRQLGLAKMSFQLGAWRQLCARYRDRSQINVVDIAGAFLKHPQGSKSSAGHVDRFGFWNGCLADMTAVVIQRRPLQ